MPITSFGNYKHLADHVLSVPSKFPLKDYFKTILVFPWRVCCYALCCPKGFLSSPHFLKIPFSFCCSAWIFFSTLSSKSLIQSSASSDLLFIPSSVLFISGSAFFISNWFFFMVSMSFSCCWASL